MTTMRGEKILVTGLTGQVGEPVAIALAAENEVWGAARFGSARRRARLEAAGVRCEVVDLVSSDFSELPDDFTYVVDFAVAKTNNWDLDITANAEALGLLMAHCRNAKAFLHCSSTAVYQPSGSKSFVETDPLGDNHRVLPFLETYSITKIAAEAVARLAARQWNLPTTIARLNVPYGDKGGWPSYHLESMINGDPIALRAGMESAYNPIHEEDIVRSVPGLLAAATVPATIVNWGGDDRVTINEWCAYLGELTGLEPKFLESEDTLPCTAVDVTKLQSLVGPSTVGWRDGFRRMVATRHPELLAASA
jgi:UDP-glucuronate 4-epimerase